MTRARRSVDRLSLVSVEYPFSQETERAVHELTKVATVVNVESIYEDTDKCYAMQFCRDASHATYRNGASVVREEGGGTQQVALIQGQVPRCRVCSATCSSSFRSVRPLFWINSWRGPATSHRSLRFSLSAPALARQDTRSAGTAPRATSRRRDAAAGGTRGVRLLRRGPGGSWPAAAPRRSRTPTTGPGACVGGGPPGAGYSPG